MFSIYFTEQHNLFREGLRTFLKKEVVPHVDRWEKAGRIDKDIWVKMGEMGYFGIGYPEVYGGMELDIFYTVIFLEELQRINSGGFAAAMWAHTYLAMTHLDAEGSTEIKEKYLAPSIRGEKIGCLCITEPFGGSDVAAMRSQLQDKGDHFLLNGSKTFITNGVYSDYLIVAAKSQTNVNGERDKISLVVVDRESTGLSARSLEKLGWKASDTGEIAFDNVRVPKQNLLGELHQGFYYIMQHFASERLIMAINAHARAEYAIEYTLQYMNERHTFGQKLTTYQALRHKMVDLIAEVDTLKAYNYLIAQQMDRGAYVVKEASIAKLRAAEAADKIINTCLQMLGGYGYMEEYPLARMWRDSRLGPIGGGTSEILKEIIAKIVIDKKVYTPKISTD